MQASKIIDEGTEEKIYSERDLILAYAPIK